MGHFLGLGHLRLALGLCHSDRLWNGQLLSNHVEHIPNLDCHLTLWASLGRDLSVLENIANIFHVLGHRQRSYSRYLDFQAVDPQGHCDNPALIHNLKNLGNHGNQSLVDQPAKGRAQVLRELLHPLDYLGS